MEEIAAARELLGDRIIETPVHAWRSGVVVDCLGRGSDVMLKLELLQHAGSFKARGALVNLLSLDEPAREKGVCAFSAGNHAIAVSFAARMTGVSAKVVMPKTASKVRVERCRANGAEVLLCDSISEAAERVEQIEQEEGRTFVHPYEGRLTCLGTASLGRELCRQLPSLDAVVVPVGGGGLIAGIAAAVKQMNARCLVYGVEPEGAASTRRSLDAGRPMDAEKIETIADSLAAPRATPFSFGLIQRYVDDVVLVNDDQMRWAMALAFNHLKLAIEPAPGAAIAATFGPLRQRLTGKRCCILVCGTNIDFETWYAHVQSAPAGIA